MEEVHRICDKEYTAIPRTPANSIHDVHLLRGLIPPLFRVHGRMMPTLLSRSDLCTILTELQGAAGAAAASITLCQAKITNGRLCSRVAKTFVPLGNIFTDRIPAFIPVHTRHKLEEIISRMKLHLCWQHAALQASYYISWSLSYFHYYLIHFDELLNIFLQGTTFYKNVPPLAAATDVPFKVFFSVKKLGTIRPVSEIAVNLARLITMAKVVNPLVMSHIAFIVEAVVVLIVCYELYAIILQKSERDKFKTALIHAARAIVEIL